MRGIDMGREIFDCIIIGGGVGGLSTAAYLSRAGVKTLLLEQHENVGGAAGTHFFDGYRFDVGGTPSCGHIPMLKELGVDDLVTFIPMGNPGWVIYFPGFTISGPKPVDEFLAQFRSLCTPQEIKELTKIVTRLLSINMGKFTKLNQVLNESKMKFLLDLITINPLELIRVATLMMQDSVTWLKKNSMGDKAFEVICFINAFIWMFPCERVPALFNILSLTGFTGKIQEGWHIIKGGNISFSLALGNAIERHGGVIKTGSKVKKILVRNGAASGVVLENGEEIDGKYIVSNAGCKETVRHLIGIEHFDGEYVTKIESLKPAPSLFKICLGLKKKPELQAVINCKTSFIRESSWWEAIEGGYLPDKPPLFFWNKSLVDPSRTPGGRYDIDVTIPAPLHHREGDWDTVKKKERDKVLSELEELIPGVSDQIEFEKVFTPKDFEVYSGHEGGGILAIEPSVAQLMKFPAMEMPIQNLFCVGSTAKGGAGINNSTTMGKKCAQKIITLINNSSVA
jgi:phytoene dehydrogenase-like protein